MIRLVIAKEREIPIGCYFSDRGVIVSAELATQEGFRVEPEDAKVGLILFAEYCKHAAALLPRHADPKSIPETG